MKKWVLIGLISLFGTRASAQVLVGGVNINEKDITYCQLIGSNRSGGLSTTRIWIDYGQPRFAATPFNQPAISGPDGVAIDFPTVMAALNFMTRNGWELVSWQLASDKEGGEGRFVYLLKKRGNQTSQDQGR